MTSYIPVRPGENTSSKKLVDPNGEDLTEILEAFRIVDDAISHGVTKTRSSELRAGAIMNIVRYIRPIESFPTKDEGDIAVTMPTSAGT